MNSYLCDILTKETPLTHLEVGQNPPSSAILQPVTLGAITANVQKQLRTPQRVVQKDLEINSP